MCRSAARFPESDWIDKSTFLTSLVHLLSFSSSPYPTTATTTITPLSSPIRLPLVRSYHRNGVLLNTTKRSWNIFCMIDKRPADGEEEEEEEKRRGAREWEIERERWARATCKRNLITSVDKLESFERQKRLVFKMQAMLIPATLLTMCIYIEYKDRIWLEC